MIKNYILKCYKLLILLLVLFFNINYLNSKEFLNFLDPNKEISKFNLNIDNLKIVIGGNLNYLYKDVIFEVIYNNFFKREIKGSDPYDFDFDLTDKNIENLNIQNNEDFVMYFLYKTHEGINGDSNFEYLKKNLLKYKSKKIIIELDEESYKLIDPINLYFDNIEDKEHYEEYYGGGSTKFYEGFESSEPEENLAKLILLIKNDIDLNGIKIGIIFNSSLLLNGYKKNFSIYLLRKINKLLNNNEKIIALDYIYIKNFNTFLMKDEAQECSYDSKMQIANCYFIPLKMFILELINNFNINLSEAKEKIGCIFYAGKDDHGMEHKPENLEKATRILTSYGIKNFGLISLQNDFPKFEYWNAIHRGMYNK